MWYQPPLPFQSCSLLVSNRLALPPFLLRGLILTLIGGCSTAPGYPPEPPPSTVPETETTSEVRTPDPESATLALLRQSERAKRAGEHAQAVGYIERAIRLNPRQADLWTKLAVIHLNNHDPDQAQRFANKAIVLAGSRADWLRDAWLVIADAKAQQGEHAQAKQIRKRWRSYRG